MNVETILDVPRVQNNEYTLEKANETQNGQYSTTIETRETHHTTHKTTFHTLPLVVVLYILYIKRKRHYTFSR